MGNAAGTELPAPHSPPVRLRLRRGKKIAGCPCFLSEQASTWEALTTHSKFRGYALRHLLDEGFICSVLENGEREHALGACEGVLYYKYMEDDNRSILRDKLVSWQRAAGAGVVACEGLTAESAFAELQLARPRRAYGFLPTLQRRLAVLRELGPAIAEEQRSRCRPFHMRLRSPPPRGGGQEQGDVRLALTMNAVALQALSTLASLAAAMQNLPSGSGNQHSNIEMIWTPFTMLADMLGEFPAQSLFKFWSPMPSEPEIRVPVNPDTATASSSASLARLAVSGGLHVGWKSTSTASTFVTWQVALSEPATDITSVAVQWGSGDPVSGSDQQALPLTLNIEASTDGGKQWYGITGGDEAVDVALAHKASGGSSRHRYPVSLTGLRRRRDSERKSRLRATVGATNGGAPAVTHVRLKMKGPSSSGSTGALRIYDVAINVRDRAARRSDVMAVLRQIQTFLLAQHSHGPIGLQECILRALLGVCQASCALEFELDLVRVYMDRESVAGAKSAPGAVQDVETVDTETSLRSKGGGVRSLGLGAGKELQAFVSTLVSAACRVKRQACRQDRERVISDAGFDPARSSRWVVISEGGQLVSSEHSGHSHSLVHQCLRRGTWSWVLGLERESRGDETTCVGVAVHPVINSCYEDSHQMWMVRCFSGETYSNGGRRKLITCKIHPLDAIRLTLNCEAGALSLEVNGVDQGVVFSNIPRDVHPAVCFYGVTKSVRLVELKRTYGDSDGDTSDSDDEGDTDRTKQQQAVETKQTTPNETPTEPDSRTTGAIEGKRPDARRRSVPGDGTMSNDVRAATAVDDPKPPNHLQTRKSQRKAVRLEEEAVASAIHASMAVSPSAGLLASLADLAQWYVPQNEDDSEVEQQGAAEKGADGARMERDRPSRMTTRQEFASSSYPVPDSAAEDYWGMSGSRDGRRSEATRRLRYPFSLPVSSVLQLVPRNTACANLLTQSLSGSNVCTVHSLDSISGNEPWQHAGREGGLSNPLTVSIRRPSAAGRTSTSAGATGDSPSRSGLDAMERRRAVRARTAARVSAAVESVQNPASIFAGRSKDKPLALEEPYAIQPTATVFRKLYDLLMRSLAELNSGSDESKAGTVNGAADQTAEVSVGASSAAKSMVLALLQIMRANFCRLVDAHVDPAEVGLLLQDDRDRHRPEGDTEVAKQDGDSLMPDILRCLQGIMLQDKDDPVLLRATVDTFSSGLPLLMPRIEDRLRLLLALVRHLQFRSHEGCEKTETQAVDKNSMASISDGHNRTRASGVPRERVTLLRNLLRHFSRTESVLQLLSLFEEDEAERTAISELLELMLIALADKASQGVGDAFRLRTTTNAFTHEKNGQRVGEPLHAEGADHAAHPRPATSTSPEQGADDGNHVELSGDDTRARVGEGSKSGGNHWEQLVSSGTGGAAFSATLLKTLETCQQHLLCMVLGRDPMQENPHELLLCQYGQCLLQVCCRVLSLQTSNERDAEDDGSPWWHLIGVLLPPFLHGLCMCSNRSRIAEGMLPSLVRLSEALSTRIAESPTEATVAVMADEIRRQTQLKNPEEGLALAPSGWHPVRASFEVDKDCMTSFAISEDGRLYSALQSSNTCALVDVGVSQGKAAWEFLLEEDTLSDECSMFGIATKPVHSRCYNSSPSLRMRRAYNGVLYDRGRQLPGSHNMPKVHPGDVVRCEVDMDEGTVRFRINGEKQHGGFDGVEGEVYPCAGSYRTGVMIRLLKMEIMGGVGLTRGSDETGTGALVWNPTEVSWAPAPCSKATRGGLVSIDKKAMEMRRMTDSSILSRQWATPTSVNGAAACIGGVCLTESGNVTTHDLVSSSPPTLPQDGDPATPPPSGESATREGAAGLFAQADAELDIADDELWEWVSVRATRGFGPSQGKHAVEMEVTPIGVGRRRTIANTRACNDAERTSLRRYPMAFGLCTQNVRSHDRPIGLLQGSWGWWTDGSLRALGEFCVPAQRCGNMVDEAEAAKEPLYGSDFLPLTPCDVITMVSDTFRGTLRYLVNGVDAGVAFGPPGSGAACVLPVEKAPFTWNDGAVLFPACSLTNDKQVVQLRPAGTLGTQVWPLCVDLHKTVASLSGRFCATMVAGSPQDEDELALEPWLRSPLLSGGVQASEDVMGPSEWHSLGRRSWKQAWDGEQEGRLVRTRSFMAWRSGGENMGVGRVHPGRHASSVAQGDPGGGNDGMVQGFQLRLAAHVQKATRIPRGLVMWPDDPSVRLIAVVDGRDDSSKEEVLTLFKTTVDVDDASTTEKMNVANDSTGVREHNLCGKDSLHGCDEARSCQREHVFTLRIARDTRAVGGDDQGSVIPSISLRAEILVGGIVTALGELSVPKVWETTVAGSNDSVHVLRLRGAGEVTIALHQTLTQLGWIDTLADAGRLPNRIKETPSPPVSHTTRERSESVESDTLDCTLMQRFLERIARSGAVMSPDSFATRERSRKEPLFCDRQDPSVSRSAAALATGSEEANGGPNYTGDETLFADLSEWLERSHPDPPFLRMALEKAGNYSFPLVEAPFVAALLKHSGLVEEAVFAAKMMSTKNEGDDGGCQVPPPTEDMAKLWGRVRQLRAHLRTQQQQHKMMAADSVPQGSRSPRRDSDGKDRYLRENRERGGGNAAADEKNDPGVDIDMDMEMEEKEEPAEGSNRSSEHPSTFAELCAQSTERANFLLELAPSTIRCPTAAALGTSVLMHHLAEELSDLPTPPPARLRSRLLRWRSEDHGKERWKGIVDVLRVQSQLRRSTSMSHRPRAKSLGSRPLVGNDSTLHRENTSERNLSSPCIREGQAISESDSSDGTAREKPVLTSLASLAGDSCCASGDESDESGDSGLLDNATAASAALQACTIYVITGGAVASPQTLKRTLRNRMSRAAMRTFGLEALAALIRILAPDGVVDASIGAQSAIQEALVFLRPAFRGLCVKGGKDGEEVEITSDKQDARHHYLKALEGCSAGVLAGVQAAFEDLYGLLRTLLDCSLQAGQPGLAHVLMTSWALDFESRDCCFLVHESGILPTLQAMVTLTNTADMARSEVSRRIGADTRSKNTLNGESVVSSRQQRWTPWSLDSVREGFVQGTMMARHLARHISRIPPSALPLGFLEKAGLHGTAAEILDRHSMASLVRRYSALLRAHLQHAQAQLEEEKQSAVEKRERLEKIECDRVAELIARGVPVLDEREGKKASEVRLTAFCTWATVPLVESVACNFARGVCYMGAGAVPIAEAPSVLSAVARSGNYYEVTVMNPGEKTTIGVGLADPDVFPVTKQMPGWVDHSYGYHGDDGRKFGRGKTESIWPTWVDGDVIGCGFDSARCAIWYTRNGKLLGDGFVMVYESKLVPVVGFHSNGESVRVNFGIAPFVYKGPEVIVAPAVLAERERLQREVQQAKKEMPICGDNHGDAVDEQTADGDLADEKEPDPVEGRTIDVSKQVFPQTKSSVDALHLKDAEFELPPAALVPSLKEMQRGASSLLRFLMAVSMRQALPAAVAGRSDGGLQQPTGNASPRRVEDGRPVAGENEKLVTPTGRVKMTGTDGTAAASAVNPMLPTRERSIYGTPFKHMQTHVDNLHQDIFDILFRELRLGAQSLEYIVTNSPDSRTPTASKWQREAEFDRNRLSAAARSTLSGQSLQPDMRRSCSAYLSRGGDERSASTHRDLRMPGDGNDGETPAANNLRLLALEVGEVEPNIFGHLALLCSMRHYAVTRVQLAHRSALGSILLLLKIGSPRVQRCVLLLLGAVLPSLEPSVIDTCLPIDWLRSDREVAYGSMVSAKPGSRREQESPTQTTRSPQSFDGLVGVLFSAVRRAYAPVSLLGDNAENGHPHGSTFESRGDGGIEVGGISSDAMRGQRRRGHLGSLLPGCGEGFGGGLLDLCLADQCGSLLRELFKEPAWKELIARMLLVSIRTAASSIRELSTDTSAPSSLADTAGSTYSGPALRDVMSDAVAALAIIAGSSGVLYPGAAVQSKSGARGTVVVCSAGDAEAGVVFDGENVEVCERVLIGDLEAVGAGFEVDPDTPAQPVIAQLLALLTAVLSAEELTTALSATDPDVPSSDVPAMAWSRLLSQTLVAVLQLSVHCSDAVVAACQEGDVVAGVLPMLLQLAVCPIQLPALITAKEFRRQWRAAQSRMLSALHLGDDGLRTLQPIQKRLLPPPEPSAIEKAGGEARISAKERNIQSPSGSRDTLSAEESRGQSLTLTHPQGHADSRPMSPDLSSAQWARIGGRGRLMAVSDTQRGWSRGWGSAVHSRRAVVAWGSMERAVRSGMDDDDNVREGGRQRLLRSEMGQRAPSRGRRAASVESRLDPRWSMTRAFHDRIRGYTEPRDEETGALLVEFNDGTDETAADLHGVEGGSAGSAETADTSRDGDEEEIAAGAVGEPRVEGVDEVAHVDGGFDPRSRALGLFVSGDRSIALSAHTSGDERPAKTTRELLGFPISHMLEFTPEAKAEREAFGARLSEEVGVPLAMAISALEAFGDDHARARQWLLTQQESTDASRRATDQNTTVVLGKAQTMEDVHVDDDVVVGDLLGTRDGGLTGGGSEAAGVPSAEEGLNLWGPDAGEVQLRAPITPASTQSVSLLCEHDLVPVLGIPRPAPELGGPTGTVSTSFLVREADLLVPGSLLVITTGEGYAPEEVGPSVTVAREMKHSVRARGGYRRGSSNFSDLERGLTTTASQDHEGASSGRAILATRRPVNGGAEEGLIVDGEEVLVEMMDAETGLCVGRRVPMGDLRHSTSFFGRKLNTRGTTVKQLLHRTDTALSMLRARSLLVRLIHGLHTPAIAAAGGPTGLLNLTRLLAAQDLAKGSVPSSVWGSADYGHGRNNCHPSEAGLVAGEGHENNSKSQRTKEHVDTPQSNEDSLLKVLWLKVMQSPEQWTPDGASGAGSATLGEMLAQEVLDSFSALTTAPQNLMSGDENLRDNSSLRSIPPQAGDVAPIPETTQSSEDSVIIHESLHPLCTPLSYGGHIKVDPSGHGMVIKLDSRSRTSSDLLRLQFFTSKENMLTDRNPVRVMHGHVEDRATRARAKGMEFFKIEEADSTSFDVASSSLEDALSSGTVDRLTLPPSLARQTSSSTTASASSVSPLAALGTPRRAGASSRAMAVGLHETHSQMVAKRWERLKEAPMPIQSNAFRSFALPGVHELWFRFDAPPGAEEPPLQISPLVGSLECTSTGTIRAKHDPSRDIDARAHSEQDEDLSQEDMGLKALFSFFGAENAANDAVSESSLKHVKSAESCDNSDSRESLKQGKVSLPGCLAAPADVRLTSGKWYYEVKIESLTGPSIEDDCLVRIGWATLDLSTALQLSGACKPNEGDFSWDAGTVGVGYTSGSCGVLDTPGTIMQQSIKSAAELSRWTSTTSSEPPRRGGVSGWTFDSTASCPPYPATEADESRLVEAVMADGALLPGSTANEEGLAYSTDSSELRRLQDQAQGIGFPVLGSDSENLGLGLGQQGFVWLGGRPRVRASHRLKPTDVIGCAIDVDSGNAWFSVNGMWAMGAPDPREGTSIVNPFKWGIEKLNVGYYVQPCLSVRGKASVSVNFGATPFKYSPPGSVFLPVVLRDVHARSAAEDRSVNPTNKVSFASEIAGQSSRKLSKSSNAADGALHSDWGFRFVVDPLRGVPFRVVRELELICRLGGGRVGAGSSGGRSQVLSIWRPKARPGWFSVGDVASRGLLPPAGAIVVRADATGCLMSKPAKFRMVHQDKNSGFVVWRPVPRKGQVSLGDFACAKKASKTIMTGAVRCVAAWAVERCRVVECLWKEEKQTGSQAIWSVQNGLGTFFGSQTGGRLSKREVTHGPQSRAERQKRKKKKKKKKGTGGGDSSEDEEAERVKLRLGVGEGWAIRGVSASCITNEWRQESDVISGPVTISYRSKLPSLPQPVDAVDEQPKEVEGDSGGSNREELLRVSRPRPSVSWASWLLSFLLNHPSLRRLAMRPSLFRTLVSYLRSPGAPHRLHIVPLLTLLIRSHEEFEDGPPPLQELDGLTAAVLQECDRVTCGRGPGSAAWKPSDCPGGMQLETKWANEGLLLLTDLVTATRRAQDSLALHRCGRSVAWEREGQRAGDLFSEAMKQRGVLAAEERAQETGQGDVQVTLPPFGTRVDEGPVEEGEEEDEQEMEQCLADRVLVAERSLGAEDRALLEVDLRNAVLPDAHEFLVSSREGEEGSLQDSKATTESPSRCLHHLIEIMDTLKALRDGWPFPMPKAAREASVAEAGSQSATGTPPYLDAILCEAWMDAVGPAAVVESEHPFRKGTNEETLCFPGAEEMVIFLDPRSSMNAGTASLVLEGADKMVTLTGRQETPWSDVITFRGDSVTYRFIAETDGEHIAGGSLVDDPGVDDWGFRFTMVANGPVWEVLTVGDDLSAVGKSRECEARIPGALSLLVEVDQLPPECDIEVQGFDADGEVIHRGLLTDASTRNPIYVKGDKVMLVPLQRQAKKIDSSAGGKGRSEGQDAEPALSTKEEDNSVKMKRRTEMLSPEEPVSLSETDAMPDADAKLERLPSNTPVLRPWGEAAGIERRWRSPADETFDMERLELAGCSYVSNTATVEVADSDADSKDGSFNSAASSTGERPQRTRYPTLDDVISSGLPLLTAMSSESSEAANRSGSNAPRALLGTASTTASGSGRGSADTIGDTGNSIGDDRAGNDAGGRAAVEATGDGQRVGDAIVYALDLNDEVTDDVHSRRALTSSSRPRACAGAKDGPDELQRSEVGGEEGSKPCSIAKWAVKIRAAAVPRKARLRLYLQRRLSLGPPSPSLQEAREWMMAWTPEMDVGLLDLLGASGTKSKEPSLSGRVSDTLNPWCCRLTRAEARFQLQRLAAVPTQSLHIRAALMLRLNDRIERVLPVIDLASRQEDSLGWQLREMNHVVLPRVKNAVLEAALAATQGPGDGVTVTLDNVKSMMSRDKGEKDLASSQCVFAQAYRQLRDTEAKVLRTVWDGERVFQINFIGEDGVDAGGVFREGMSRMVEDVFSPDFDLLIQCPNGRQAIGQNNEKYVPNPQHSSPLALSMLRFVGRLMGLSLRTRLCLPFQIPGIIWKRMLGLQVGFEDLRMVDTIICQFLTAIRTCEDDGLTSDAEFRDKYGERLFFTCTGSDGVERELTPGGAARRVTYHNRWTFCRMVEEARTHEFDAQAAAMAEGLADIVPLKVLRLFTAKQLEIAVAGEPEFDLAFWKKHTEYKGYGPEDVTVELFWKVIESMTPEDQSGFVRFAWGRSRLPPKSYWRVNMKLLRRNTSEDSLPVSHTCFFSVELPPYSTEDLMRKGLLTAIHFGMGGILNA